MKNKINWKYFVLFFIVFSIIVFSIIGIFISSNFWSSESSKHIYDSKDKIILKNEIPWYPKDWTYPFYFTIQSNFLVMIYLFLLSFSIIKPKINKKSYIFELITLVNITITLVVFWTILLPQIGFSIFENWFLSVENFTLHLIAPAIMLFIFFYKIINNKQKVFLNYKEFWVLFIYPIIWLIMSIILYYSTRERVIYTQTFKFENPQLAKNWHDILHNKYNFIYSMEIQGSILKVSIKGWWGNAIYFFLNFDNLPFIVIIICIFAILLLFILFVFLFISFSNPKYKLNKYIRNIKRKNIN